MKLAQIKVPELATDALMAYTGMRLDHPTHANPTDSFHHSGGQPDLLPGLIMGGLHGAVGAGTLIGGAYNEDGKMAVQGLWEAVKSGGFCMQIVPSLGAIGAGLVACGTLGDVCSGWVAEPFKDWAQSRQASKARGPAGCAGPED